MARKINRLSAVKVEKLKQPGYHADGAGLWLQVTMSGAKSWIFRFMLNGRSREMGLGPVHTISLAEARHKATDARKLLIAKIDPIEAKRGKIKQEQLEEAKSKTFNHCAAEYIKAHRGSWTLKHAEQWQITVKDYAIPILGHLPVSSIDTALVMQVLTPIWQTRTETASRLRGRIESILDWAAVHGYRTSDNPARWRGHLDKLLPRRSKIVKVTHYPALPYDELPAFIKALRQQKSIAAKALEFTILTAARTGEVINATWDEIDLANEVWAIPSSRMKASREHRVPLSSDAMAIVRAMNKIRSNNYVFPGIRPEQPIGSAAMLKLLVSMMEGKTVHGFRSTFRDWCAERTSFPYEVAEMALAHNVGSKVEAAYRRGDLFEKRRRLMEDWARFCTMLPVKNKVTPIRKAVR